jgi:putative ABC transport system permease protein
MTTILFGLVPAVQSCKMGVLPGLRDGATATAGRRRTRLRGALVTAQITFSTLLLIGAGVLVRSMTNARAIDLGFSADRILIASRSKKSIPRSRGYESVERSTRVKLWDS